jgi:hypothetical protein
MSSGLLVGYGVTNFLGGVWFTWLWFRAERQSSEQFVARLTLRCDLLRAAIQKREAIEDIIRRALQHPAPAKPVTTTRRGADLEDP